MTFNEFYESHFADRWPAIREALLCKPSQVAFLNPFLFPAQKGEVSWLPGCVTPPEKIRRDEQTHLLESYILDPASVLVARALDVKTHQHVLDMCAAPGGKTLVLAESLTQAGELTANEPSEGRRQALFKVIQNYIPKESRNRFWVKGWDGQRVGLFQKEVFDRILIDAPCSGERHLLAHPKELKEWTPQRSRRLAQKQFALLSSASLALKPGGEMVYSTCAMSPFENDAVIKRILERRPELKLKMSDEPPSPYAEKTQWGWIYLPDHAGFGPMYFSKISKEIDT